MSGTERALVIVLTVFLAFMVALVWIEKAHPAESGNLVAKALRQASRHIAPQLGGEVIGDRVRQVIYTAAETRLLAPGLGFPGCHLVSAHARLGGMREDIEGAVVSRRGKIRCEFHGTNDEHCLRLEGCISGVYCD